MCPLFKHNFYIMRFKSRHQERPEMPIPLHIYFSRCLFWITWCQNEAWTKSSLNLYNMTYSNVCKCLHSSDIRELSSYRHISKKIVWKYYHATISIWSPNNSGVKISVSLTGFRIYNIICTPFWGFGSYRPVSLKKAQNLQVFY